MKIEIMKNRKLEYPLYKLEKGLYEYRNIQFKCDYIWNSKLSYDSNMWEVSSALIEKCCAIDRKLDIDRTGETNCRKALDDFCKKYIDD